MRRRRHAVLRWRGLINVEIKEANTCELAGRFLTNINRNLSNRRHSTVSRTAGFNKSRKNCGCGSRNGISRLQNRSAAALGKSVDIANPSYLPPTSVVDIYSRKSLRHRQPAILDQEAPYPYSPGDIELPTSMPSSCPTPE